MSQLQHNSKPFLYNLVLYAAALLLFLEWVYPVEEVAEPFNLEVFIIFAVFCFFISWVRLHWLLSFSLKLTALIFVINSLFIEASFFTKAWFTEVALELSFNIDVMFGAEWFNLTAFFRTILFLLLIWLMSYLLYYWFVTAKRLMLFVVLTFVYLGVLDTFTVYDGSHAIIRTFAVAFLALGISNFMKEAKHEALTPSKKAFAWQIPIIAVVLLSSLIGYAAPKLDPQWPDPVPFIESYADNAGVGGSGTTVRKVGYGEDDTRLGGSFVQDDTAIFRAAAEEKGYWRVETKSIYTGKGWESFRETDFAETNDGQVDFDLFSDRVLREKSAIDITFYSEKGIGKLPYQYGTTQFVYLPDSVSDKGEGYTFLHDDMSGAVQYKRNSDPVSTPQYQTSIERPVFNKDALRATPGKDPEDINRQYTQLPPSLPERVYELAEELTAGIDNRYDKAKTIEQYFGRSGYVYQIQDVPVPEADEDYVDQFLFDSQVGYCDNYSTTMAVMLRTLDIPTRWVKGFTPGEKVDEQEGVRWAARELPKEKLTAEDGMTTLDVFEVKSSNAHSWVEVYFPTYGWVPFEPTQGFYNPTDFETSTTTDYGEQEEPDSPDLDEGEEPEPEIPEEDVPAAEEDEDDTETAARSSSDPFNWWLLGGVIAAIVLALFIVFKTRWRWRTAYYRLKMKRHPSQNAFQKAYDHLLNVLDHKGLAKRPDQTLREYALRIDGRFNTHLMGELTRQYEQMIYSLETPENVSELTERWQLLMKQIES